MHYIKAHDFEWDEVNETHIASHHVKPEEAEEIFLGYCFVRKSHSGRYGAYGQSLNGRYLFVVFEKLEDTRIRVITARDMSKREKKYYRGAK